MTPVHLVPRSRRDLRFASGLVLFTYVTLHLGCHALGLVSLGAAERALDATAAFWQTLPGTALLYGAALVHVGLALLAIYERRTLRMAPAQALRIVLGLLMPVALIGHFIGTRYAFERYGIAAEYPRVVGALWSGGGRGLALGLLAPGWLHGCLGLRYALGHRRTWQRVKPVLFAVALLLPVFAAVGFVTMARTVEAARVAGTLRLEPVTAPQVDHLVEVRDDVLAAYLGMVGFVAFARLVRRLDEHRRRSLVRIAYPGRDVVVPRGWTVLEASRSHDIPHLAACGGRARCSTCRVRVLEGLARCPPAHGDERRTLERIRAPADVRLACQLRPTGDVSVETVLAVERSRWQAAAPLPRLVEREAALVALAVRLSGPALPAHDRYYVLDRCRAIAETLFESSGAVAVDVGVQRWCGIFGLEGTAEAGARRALAAAERLLVDVDGLAARLVRELGVVVRPALVVHAGPIVVGRIGGADSNRHAAIGEALDGLDALLDEAARATPPLVRSARVLTLGGAQPRPAVAA